MTDRGDPHGQARSAFERMRAVLEGFEASLDDVVQMTSFHLDPASMEAARKVALDVFGPERAPAWSAVAMTGFWREGQLHSFHALARP